MYGDTTPFSPLSVANGLHGYISINALHWVCVITGLFGIAVWFFAALWQRRQQRKCKL